MFYNRKKGRICLVRRGKATTFAAALRVKPTTHLQFNHLLPIAIGITIARLEIQGIKKLSFYFKKSLVV